jgi:hypothetical protein
VLIVWTSQREILILGIWDVGGVAAYNYQVFKPAVVAPWNHVVWVLEVWVIGGMESLLGLLVC